MKIALSMLLQHEAESRRFILKEVPLLTMTDEKQKRVGQKGRKSHPEFKIGKQLNM